MAFRVSGGTGYWEGAMNAVPVQSVLAKAKKVQVLKNRSFPTPNTTVVLGVGKERFFSTWTFLAFASTDCTGTAFIAPSQYPVPPLTLNAIRNGSVYVPDASAP